jgi:hypothetical protein
MPLIEYRCLLGHTTERLFLSSAEAEKPVNQFARCKEQRRDLIRKKRCNLIAHRVTASQTGAPILKGGGSGGFYSPTQPERNPEN